MKVQTKHEIIHQKYVLSKKTSPESGTVSTKLTKTCSFKFLLITCLVQGLFFSGEGGLCCHVVFPIQVFQRLNADSIRLRYGEYGGRYMNGKSHGNNNLC